VLRRLLGTTLLTIAALAAWAGPASATFHLIQIREVYPGSPANPNSEYVELQMWAPDQHHVAGHVLRSYDAGATLTGSDAFAADVPRGADQSTLVLATPEAEAEFGFVADAPLSPSGRLDPSAGAACWENLDCVAWGSFAGALPSPAGMPAAGMPAGMALRRTIAPGCPTLLELSDDHDDSAADFAAVFPGPRPNAIVPSEHGCEAAGGGRNGGAAAVGAGRNPPQTVLRRSPPRRSRDRTPTFRFAAAEAAAKFECLLDSRRFRPCRSPFTSRPLAVGRHVFRVRARDDAGQLDSSPARFAFRVLPRR
jgi:hypothetical protein